MKRPAASKPIRLTFQLKAGGAEHNHAMMEKHVNQSMVRNPCGREANEEKGEGLYASVIQKDFKQYYIALVLSIKYNYYSSICQS